MRDDGPTTSSSALPEPAAAVRWPVARRVIANFRTDNITLIVGGVAFFSLLSVIPAMAVAVSLYGFVADPTTVTGQVNDLGATMPPEAKQLLTDQLDSLTSANRATLGAGLVLGIVLALWAASGALKFLAVALTAVYHEQETRGYVKLKALGLAATLLALVVGGVAFLIVDSPHLVGEGPAATVLSILRWPLVGLVAIVSLDAVYRFAPIRREPRWQWPSVGAVSATVVWVLATGGFTFYVGHFGSYNKTYGTLAGVIVLMLWLFISAVCVLLGGEINAELKAERARWPRAVRPRR